MNSNPNYPQKPKLLTAVSESIGDLKSVLTQRIEKRKLDNNKTVIGSSNSGIKLKRSQQINEKVSYSHMHNIKGLSDVIEKQKVSNSKGKKKIKVRKGEDETLKMTKAEENALKKSREMLEKKAKIYEAMSKGALVYDPEGETIMVDFSKKSQDYDEKNDYHANEMTNSVGECSHDSDLKQKHKFDIENTKNDEEQLLEYVDKFGRTRLLKQSQIDELKANDPEERNKQKLFSANVDNSKDDHNDNVNRSEDVQYAQNQDEFEDILKKDIHYQDIQDGEIREHGVAFYKFSTDAQEREQQMKTLKDMHKETIKMQRKVKQERQERRKLARERLIKICQDKGLPIPVEDLSSEDEEEKLKDEERNYEDKRRNIGDEIRIQKGSLTSSKIVYNKDGHREWDDGKNSDNYWKDAGLPVPPKRTPFYTQQQFIQKQRDERNSEFAPPQIYQSTSTSGSKKK